MSSKSLDLIIGANVPASINKLKADLKTITATPLELDNIKLSAAAVTNLQNEIQAAVSAKTYNINVGLAGAGTGAGSKGISAGIDDYIKSYKARLLSSDYYDTLMRKNGVDATTISQLTSEYQAAVNGLNALNIKTAPTNQILDMVKQIDLVKDKISTVNKETINPKFDQNFATNVAKTSLRISELMNKFPQLEKQMPSAFSRLSGLMTQITAGNLDDGKLRDIKREYQEIAAEIEKAGIATETFGSRIKRHVLSQLGNMMIAMAVRTIRKSIREVYNSVKDIDTAMTELKKVTDLTTAAYDNFRSRAADVSVSLGAKIDDYINATADFARLGYGLADAEELAKSAIVYKNVGDGIENISDASESIISTMKAFNIEATNSMDIIDAFNEVGNKYAISSTGIGTALKSSAAALAQGNNSLAESIGLVVAANDVLQNPTQVGTALKSISMYLRAAKSEAEDAGESTDGMADSVSKLRDKLLGLTGNKVDIMLDEDTYKSTYQILKELSEVWDEISDINQANILQSIAGKRGANAAASILNNFKDAEAVLKTIENDEGSALREQEKWLDSINGRLEQLKSNGQRLSQDMLDSEAVKGIINFLSGVLNLIDKIIGHKGGLAAVGAVITALLVNFKGAAIAAAIGKITSSMGGLLSCVISTAKAITWSLNPSLSNLGDLAKMSVSHVGGLTSALGIFSAAIAVIAIGVSAYNAHVQKMKQIADDSRNVYEESSRTLEEYTEKIKTARKELEEANSNSERAQKTEVLRDLEKELVDLYGAQAQGIDLVNGKLDEEIKKVNSLNKKDAIKFLTTNAKELDTAAESYQEGWDTSKWSNGLAHKDVSPITRMSGTAEWAEQAAEAKRYLESIGATISHIETTSKGRINSFDIDGDAQQRLNYLEALWDYMQKAEKFNESTGEYEKIFDENAINRVSESISRLSGVVDSYKDTLSEGANAWAIFEGTSEQRSQYEKYISLIEQAQEQYSDGDISALLDTQKGLDELLSKITNDKSIPDYVKQHLKNLYGEVFDVDLRLQLKLENADFFDSELVKSLDKFKDDFGKIDIHKLLASEADYKKVKDAANEYGTSVERIIELINEHNNTEIVDNWSKVTDVDGIASQIDKILEAEKGFDKLQKIYNDVKDAGQFDYGALRQKDFLETFNIEGMQGAYNQFLETVSQYPNDLGKCQDAFNSLTTAYIKQTGILDNLTEKNKDLTIAWLKNIGVANAEEVVNDRLSKSVEISKSAYEALNKTLGDTVEASQASTGQYIIEQSALKKLGFSASDAERIMAAAQAGITAKSREGLLARLAYYEKEALALEKLYYAMQIANDTSYNNVTGRDAASLHERQTGEQMVHNAQQTLRGATDEQKRQAVEAHKYAQELAKIRNDIGAGITAEYTPPKTGKSSGGSSKDDYIEKWKQRVKIKKDLLEQDQMTEQQYYDWLRKAYKDKSQYGPGASGLTKKQQEDYADEVAAIESELYQWEKDQIQKKIDDQDALLKNQRANGLISEAEYQKKLGKITEEGYKDLLKKVKDKELYGVDETERLEAETELLEKVKDAHIAAFEAEVSELDHLRALELITEEQYYAQRAALAAEYYGKEEVYRDELKKEEEELFKERTDLIKKYASAAKEAVSSIMDAGKSMADAVGDLVQGIIDANSSNFDLQKNLLKHQLEMNYITEEEYYKKLEVLYKTYYKSKSIYLDEYWENQEEIYNFEMETMENGASALEDIHAKVVDLIKQELEDAKDAIEETKESYNKLIDIRRKALEEEKDENDTEKSRVEKLNEIAELTRQLNALRNDNSAEGQRRYKEVFAKLIEARKKLQDFEEEQAYKAATAQLDREAESLDKQSEDATKELDDKLNDNEWLVDEAWRRLRGMNESLYNELVDYAKKHSTSIKDDVTGSWETASSAFEKYKDDVKAGYGEISQILAHPETYYPGIDSAEAGYDAELTQQKEMENYAEVLGEFAEQIADIMGTSVQSVAGILNTLFPGYITDLLVDGADIYADSLGMVGINNSLMSTVAALGGIAGIMDMMNGFQSLAEGGGEYNGIAIGGENINSILGMLQSIQNYGVGIGASNNATNDLLGLVITAIGNGAGEGSSVVTGIGTIAALATGLLTVGTTLLGGGGAGASTLFGALGTIGSLLGASNSIGSKSDDCLVGLLNVLTKVCEYNADFVNTNESLGAEVSGLRTVLYNSWKLIYNLLEQRLGSSGSMGMLGGLVGSLAGTILSGNSGTYTRLVGDETGIASVLSDNLIKVLGSSNLLGGGVISKLVDIGMSSIPSGTTNNNNTVTVNPTFQIRSNDPEGVVSAIEGIMPRIADYTISVLLNGTDNKGVKRSVTSLA